MSLSIIEIKAIPQYQLLSHNLEEAKRSVCSTFRDLLSYVSSTTYTEQGAVELVFHKSKNSQPRLLLTVRSDERGMSVSNRQFIKTVSNYLTNSNFIIQELIGEDFTEIVDELQELLKGRIVALTKSEKIVTSAISYSGYYYYTDILENLNNEKNEINNYNSLINQLMSCEKAMVCFQFIPTQMTQEEYYALSSLAGELASTTQGLVTERQMLREIAAETPQKVYTYYAERAMQPLFIGNIILASEKDDLNGLISALKTGMQSSMVGTVNFTSIEIGNTKQLSYDFYHFPWNIYNQLLYNYRNQNIWNGTIYQPTNLIRLPYLFTATEASNIFKLPVNDGKIQGIQSNQIVNDNEVISSKVFDADNILFGELLNSGNRVIGAKKEEFTRHALIVGTPGSGKTTFALNLLLQFHEKGVPFLAIEPTKTEYRALIDKIPDLQVFTPGNSSVVPFIINPFIPPKGIRLEQYIPSLMSAFRSAFSMESPLDVIFLRAIRQCYAEYGWKNSSTCDDSDVQFFGFFEFVIVFKKVVATSNYKAETRANIETGGTFRLLNLFDQNKLIYDTVNTIPIEQLLQKSTVIELNAIADDEQKALIMAMLLINICLYTKSQGSSSGRINNVLMIDEAHVLLDAPNKMGDGHNQAQSTTVKSLQKMIAEIRSFGTGIIIADQVPSKVTSDIVANTDLKIAFRLVENNERKIVVNSTNMSDVQSEHLARLKKGEAIVYYSELESPKLISTPDIRVKKNIRFQIPDEEIHNRVRFWDTRQDMLVPFYECSACPQCRLCKACASSVREKAEYYSAHIVSTIGANVKDKNTLIKYMHRLHELVLRYEAESNSKDLLNHLCNCTKIHFIRSILLQQDYFLSRNAIVDLLNQTMIKEGEIDV